MVLKNQELTVTVPPAPTFIRGDATRMAQIIANLLSNASKYTGRNGHITLTLGLDGDHAVLSVRDTGIGIRADQISRIFDMFTQVSPLLERRESGLGVGLALTRGLVDLHHGTIEAKSDGPGRGSEFIVRIPVVTAPSAARTTIPRSEERSAGFKVLVADDNVDSAVMLSEALRGLGHDVRIAHDGVASVETALSFAPDVAFLDIGMPRMNGYDAGKQMRDRFGDNITLVAITGWGQEADRRRAREASFDHHLTKPVDLSVVEKLLLDVSRSPRL